MYVSVPPLPPNATKVQVWMRNRFWPCAIVALIGAGLAIVCVRGTDAIAKYQHDFHETTYRGARYGNCTPNTKALDWDRNVVVETVVCDLIGQAVPADLNTPTQVKYGMGQQDEKWYDNCMGVTQTMADKAPSTAIICRLNLQHN